MVLGLVLFIVVIAIVIGLVGREVGVGSYVALCVLAASASVVVLLLSAGTVAPG